VVDSCASDGCTLDYEFVLGRDALAEVDASPDWTSAFLTVAEVEGDINHEAEYLTIRVNDLVVGTCLNGDLNCEEPGKGFLSDGEQCCNPQSCMSRIDVTSFLVPGATKAKVDVTGSDMVNDGDCGNHAFKLKAKFFLTLVAPVTHPPSPIPTAPSPRPTLLPTPPPSSLVAVDTPGVATPSSSEPVVSCPDLTASSSSSASSSVALEELTWITSVASACPSAQLFLFEGTSTYRSTLSGVLPNSQGSGLFEWDVGATVQALSSTSSFVLCGTSSLTLKLRCTGGGGSSDHFSGPFTVASSDDGSSTGGDDGAQSGGGADGGGTGGGSGASWGGSDDGSKSSSGIDAASSSLVLLGAVVAVVLTATVCLLFGYSRRAKPGPAPTGDGTGDNVDSNRSNSWGSWRIWPTRSNPTSNNAEVTQYKNLFNYPASECLFSIALPCCVRVTC
jgi:hypothetical protein